MVEIKDICGGRVAKGAKDLYEKKLKNLQYLKNSLNYKYIDEKEQIEDKTGEKDE